MAVPLFWHNGSCYKGRADGLGDIDTDERHDPQNHRFLDADIQYVAKPHRTEQVDDSDTKQKYWHQCLNLSCLNIAVRKPSDHECSNYESDDIPESGPIDDLHASAREGGHSRFWGKPGDPQNPYCRINNLT